MRARALALAAVVAASGAAGALANSGQGARGVQAAPVATATVLVATVPGAAAERLGVAPQGAPPASFGRLAVAGPGARGALATVATSATVVSTGTDAVGGAVVAGGVRLLDGEVTVAQVTAQATRGAGIAGPGHRPAGAAATVSGLSVLGTPVAAPAGGHVAVGDWAVLDIGPGSPTGGGSGAAGAPVTGFGVRLRVVVAHRGVPAGTVVLVGVARAVGVPPAPARSAAARSAGAFTKVAAPAPALSPGGRSFPLARPAGVTDTFGAARAGVPWHHGVDLFGPRGTAVLAVAEGVVFDVGWNPLGGHRLWLRDAAGNTFYYAHLDAYATGIRNGARVHAGQALGTLGSTGDAERTPPHLHFEVHPAAFDAIGYDGAIDPTAILRAWAARRDTPVTALPRTLTSTATTAPVAPAAFVLETPAR